MSAVRSNANFRSRLFLALVTTALITVFLSMVVCYSYFQADRGLTWLLAVFFIIVLAVAVQLLARRLSSPLEKLSGDVHMISQGRLSTLPESNIDEIGAISVSLNDLLGRMRKQMQTDEQRRQTEENVVNFLKVVSDASDGDLTVRAPVTEDAFGSIADAYNLMVESLADLLSDTNRNAMEVGRESRILLDIFQQIKQDANIQMQHVSDANQAAGTTAESARQIALKAELAQAASTKVDQATALGNAGVNNNIKGMQLIRSTVQIINKKMKSLSERLLEIGTISQLISDVATRTTILAMNASIEAARAGEQGRGFLVISDEIKRLADEAAEATRQIGDIIKAIQTESNEVTTALEEETSTVEEQTQIALDTGDALSAVEAAIGESKKVITEITNLTQAQQKISEEMVNAIGKMADITEQTSTHISKSSQISDGLNSLSNNLLASLAQFTLNRRDVTSGDMALKQPAREDETETLND